MPPGVLQVIGIAIIHLTISSAVGLCFCIVGYTLTKATAKKIVPLYLPFVFAASLTCVEILRSIILSLIFFGENGTVGMHFTSGTIGNALSTTPLIEFAYFGGTFALTFILGYLVYCFASKTHTKLYWKHGVAILIVLTFIHFFIPVYGPKEKTIVSVLATNFKTQQDSDLTRAFITQNVQVDTMTRSLISDSPDIIVYPEDTRYIEYLTNEKSDSLSTLFPETLFIDGSTRLLDSMLVNISLFYTSENKKTLARGKSFLLPFNEYIPFFFKPIFGFFVPKDQMDTYSKNHTYTPVYSQKTIPFHTMRIGTLLCSEILSYKTIQDVRHEDPSLVFFQSHLNVFHDNPWFRMHLYSFTKVAAAQLRRPLISSVNGAPSLIVSPYGATMTIIPTGFSTTTIVFPN